MKRLKLLLAAILIFSAFSFSNNAEAVNKVTIFVNEVEQSYSNKAVIENGNTLVPLRGIFEALGAEVIWNNSTRTIDATKGSNKIWLKIGSNVTKVNGKNVTVAAAPKIVNGSTLVPLRFISESLGAEVLWNGAKRTININLDNSPKALIHFIDVGQGDATLIQTPEGENILIDGGQRSHGNELVAYIKAQGIKKLDYVIATHPDADHIGGLIAVLNSISIGEFVNSGKLHTTEAYEQMMRLILDKNIKYSEPKSGDVLIAGEKLDTYLKVIYANSNADDNNDASIVIKGGYYGTDVLFMADASTDIEALLLKSSIDLSAEILKAGHHGSNTSSSLAFLQKVKPETVTLSYGADNSYGHPHKEVLTNIKSVGAKAYSTATNGTIIVTIDCEGYKINAKEFNEEISEETKPVTPNPTPEQTNFKNCTDLRKVYPNGVPKGHPAYQSKMDRDNDGWACE